MSFSLRRSSVIVRKNCPFQKLSFRHPIFSLLYTHYYYPCDFIFASRSLRFLYFFPTLALTYHLYTKLVFKLNCCEYVRNMMKNPQGGLIQPEILYRNSSLGSNSSREKFGEVGDDSVSDRNITLFIF